MARASRETAEQHREEVIKAASRLFRERDLGSVSVVDVMREVGLTQGGFYKHFSSKEALVAAAVDAAFDEHIERVETMAASSDQDPTATWQAFVDFCLSSSHRDNPGTGCPSALASGVSRTEPDSAPRESYIKGVRLLIDELLQRTVPEGADIQVETPRILSDLAMMIGAILLSRATEGDPVSDQVLAAVHQRLDADRDGAE